jgi:hypothetical protein
MLDDDGLLRGHSVMACECLREFCLFCAFRLLACTRCGALGTAWPDECPGRQMTRDEVGEVYYGRLNYRGGTWYGEPSRVMALMRGHEGNDPRSAVCDLPVRDP